MDKSSLIVTPGLTPLFGYSLMIGMGVIFLVLANLIKNALVRNTHDFIIANRRIGLGFGVGTVISVWTWAMAVMMSSAMTFKWGLSGLAWFVVPNGFAIMAMIPLANRKRQSSRNSGGLPSMMCPSTWQIQPAVNNDNGIFQNPRTSGRRVFLPD